MVSSDSICKFMSCSFIRFVPDLVYHQYGICRMYSEEYSQDFHLSIPLPSSLKTSNVLLSTEIPQAE